MNRLFRFGFTLIFLLSSRLSAGLPEDRHLFQSQELITARPFTYIFSAGDPPRIVWRDVDEVRRLGAEGNLKVRWFDSQLNESEKPATPGRWVAYIESKSPNGTIARRGLTFLCRQPGFFLYLSPEMKVDLPYQKGVGNEQVWREHHDEIASLAHDWQIHTINDTEAGVVLLGGLLEAKPLGRAPRFTETAAVMDDDLQLAVKLKVMGMDKKVRPQLGTIARGMSAPILHDGSPKEAGVTPDAKSKIDSVCQAWFADTHEPMATLVARHGVIVTHEAFGTDKAYRADVASVTKSLTAILFARFVDNLLVNFDDSIATVFPDYPKNNSHVPTFRQCLTHMSGLSGHGDFGGARNAYLENILLNGIDANEPGKNYNYSGMGFDLTAKAMEILAGKSMCHLYEDYLFAPLGLRDVPIANASAGAQLNARELATIAQLFANRGSYGPQQFVSPSTFEQMLPRDLSKEYPNVHESEGIGMHWMHPLKAGAKPESKDPKDWIFGPHVIGHGSLSGCIFMIDRDKDLIIAQVRRGQSERFGEWSTKFFQTIADVLQ